VKDDELISELLEAQARDDAADPLCDPLWEKLAAGTLSEEERKILEARAATDESLREAMALLTPLGGAFEARVTAKIGAARGKASSGADTKAANVVVLRRRVIGVIGALAVAAAVAFLALRSPHDSGASNSEGSLPKYAMLVTGGQKDVRSTDTPATGGVVRVGPDSELSLVLRPTESVASAGIELRALIVRDGAAQAWAPPYKVSPSGVVQIAGPAASLGLGAPGEIDAVVAVGRHTPSDPKVLLSPPPDATYQVFRAHLLVSSR
jgi:hypothetical protein